MIQQKNTHGAGGAHIGLWGRSLMHCMPADPKGGSGGGNDDADEDEKKFEERVNKVVHGALAAFKKDADKKLAKAIEDGSTAALAKYEEVRAAKELEDAAAKAAAGDKEKGEKGTKGSGASPEVQAELAKLKRDQESMAKKLADTEAREKAAVEKSFRTEERNALATALGGKVRPAMLEDVVDILSSKRLTRDAESGKILWKGDKEDEVLPFEDGVAQWLASDKGKEYAPARQVGGSGAGRNQGTGGAGGKGVQELNYADIGALVTAKP